MDGGIPQILKTSALFDQRAVAAAWSHVKFFSSWALNVTELGLAVLDGERDLLNMSSLVPTEGTRRLVVMGGGPIGIEMCLQALREKESAAHCNFNFHVATKTGKASGRFQRRGAARVAIFCIFFAISISN